MIFTQKSTLQRRQLKKINLNINKNNIKQVFTSKYLGVYLDNKLTWQEHVQNLHVKLSKFTGVVYKIRNFVPQKIIMMLYNALIGSYLRYGIRSWGTCSATLIDDIKSAQNKIVF